MEHNNKPVSLAEAILGKDAVTLSWWKNPVKVLAGFFWLNWIGLIWAVLLGFVMPNFQSSAAGVMFFILALAASTYRS
jgi:hypothetical protein